MHIPWPSHACHSSVHTPINVSMRLDRRGMRHKSNTPSSGGWRQPPLFLPHWHSLWPVHTTRLNEDPLLPSDPGHPRVCACRLPTSFALGARLFLYFTLDSRQRRLIIDTPPRHGSFDPASRSTRIRRAAARMRRAASIIRERVTRVEALGHGRSILLAAMVDGRPPQRVKPRRISLAQEAKDL